MRYLVPLIVVLLFVVAANAAGPTQKELTEDVTWGLKQILYKQLKNTSNTLQLYELKIAIMNSAAVLAEKDQVAKQSLPTQTSGLLNKISRKYGSRIAAQLGSYLQTVSAETLGYSFNQAVTKQGSSGYYALIFLDSTKAPQPIVDHGPLMQSVAKNLSTEFIRQQPVVLPPRYPTKWRLRSAWKRWKNALKRTTKRTTY